MCDHNFLQEIQVESSVTATFHLYFLKEIVLAHLQSLFGRSNRDAFLENEGKILEEGCLKEFFL